MYVNTQRIIFYLKDYITTLKEEKNNSYDIYIVNMKQNIIDDVEEQVLFLENIGVMK